MKKILAEDMRKISQDAINNKAQKEIGNILCGIENQSAKGLFTYSRDFYNRDLCQECMRILKDMKMGFNIEITYGDLCRDVDCLVISWRTPQDNEHN